MSKEVVVILSRNALALFHFALLSWHKWAITIRKSQNGEMNKSS
jgi:hypothetical protein